MSAWRGIMQTGRKHRMLRFVPWLKSRCNANFPIKRLRPLLLLSPVCLPCAAIVPCDHATADVTIGSCEPDVRVSGDSMGIGLRRRRYELCPDPLSLTGGCTDSSMGFRPSTTLHLDRRCLPTLNPS